MTAFEALSFSSANLFGALANQWCTADEVAEQDRANYLYRYLADIDAKSIVVENDYTDGDYLEDFASFYVRSFRNYERRCKRLHFFSTDVTSADLRAFVGVALSETDDARIVESYLGFVVARPLPSAIVGRTLLKTYPSDGGRRHYEVVRNYEANLFGRRLPVRSLPYQEQDKVLAACATVALWCAFHKTADLFGSGSPRPAVITRTASRIGHRGRPVPSHGLRIEEMCAAITDLGLEPELVDCDEGDVPWVSLAYGHLCMGLPVILVVQIGPIDLHAITLTGFSIRPTRVHSRELTIDGVDAIPLVGLRVDEFYGHDDQVGPFAHLVLNSTAAGDPQYLDGSWRDPMTGDFMKLEPIALLIPVYNKIRVTFRDVVEIWLTRLDSVLQSLIPTDSDREWDVRLTTTNSFKGSVKQLGVSPSEQESLLLNPQPRFLWTATLRVDGSSVLEVLFDATDMAPSFPLLNVLWLNLTFYSAARVLFLAPEMAAALADALTPRFVEFIGQSLSTSSDADA